MKINLRGEEAESVLTNSAYLARLLESADCESIEAVEKVLEAEIRGRSWEEDKKTFEQHMREDDEVRVRWATGSFESEMMQCGCCGDKNIWDRMHHCCDEQCRKALNALQSFPFAAWDDVSGAPLDPAKVVEARKLEMEYATKKPVWNKITRREAKARGWKVIKSRWIDINKGDDNNPNYRSRMVGKEFNIGELEGLFAATPPLEALRLILSWAATGVAGLPDGFAQSRARKCIMIADVYRAFFEAPA